MKMKKWLLLGITVFSLLIPYLVQGIEFMYIDNKGTRKYSCGGGRRGAIIGVKQVSKYQYRVYAKTISGIITFPPTTSPKSWCGGFHGVARMACGFCEVPKYDPTPQADKAE